MNSIKENESRQTSYRLGRLGSLAATPLGLGSSRAVFPRVAEYSNPGLEDRIPFGENVQTQVPQLCRWGCWGPAVRRRAGRQYSIMTLYSQKAQLSPTRAESSQRRAMCYHLRGKLAISPENP